MRRLAGSLAASLVAVALLAGPAGAAVLWTLTGSPLTATSGVSTTFSLTATNLDLANDIGCVRVAVTSSFIIEATSIVSVSSGRSWASSSSGSTVTAHSVDGGGRLNPFENMVFSVRARPLAPGVWSWTGTAYEGQDCSKPLMLSIQLAAIVVTGAAVTQTPMPTPMPTAVPTAIPTPHPTSPPILPLPSASLPTLPLPTLPVIGAVPTLPIPAGTATATRTPAPVTSARATPSASESADAEVPSGSPFSGSVAGGGEPGSGGPTSVSTTDSLGPSGIGVRSWATDDLGDLDVSINGALDLGQLWLVPAMVVGTPGLLVILWVALQIAAGVMWLPAARRLRGDQRRDAMIVRG